MTPGRLDYFLMNIIRKTCRLDTRFVPLDSIGEEDFFYINDQLDVVKTIPEYLEPNNDFTYYLGYRTTMLWLTTCFSLNFDPADFATTLELNDVRLLIIGYVILLSFLVVVYGMIYPTVAIMKRFNAKNAEEERAREQKRNLETSDHMSESSKLLNQDQIALNDDMKHLRLTTYLLVTGLKGIQLPYILMCLIYISGRRIFIRNVRDQACVDTQNMIIIEQYIDLFTSLQFSYMVSLIAWSSMMVIEILYLYSRYQAEAHTKRMTAKLNVLNTTQKLSEKEMAKSKMKDLKKSMGTLKTNYRGDTQSQIGLGPQNDVTPVNEQIGESPLKSQIQSLNPQKVEVRSRLGTPNGSGSSNKGKDMKDQPESKDTKGKDIEMSGSKGKNSRGDEKVVEIPIRKFQEPVSPPEPDLDNLARQESKVSKRPPNFFAKLSSQLTIKSDHDSKEPFSKKPSLVGSRQPSQDNIEVIPASATNKDSFKDPSLQQPGHSRSGSNNFDPTQFYLPKK